MILSPAKLNISLKVNNLLNNGYHSISSYVFFLDLFGFGQIANFAHLGGLLSGILSGYIFSMYNKKI